MKLQVQLDAERRFFYRDWRAKWWLAGVFQGFLTAVAGLSRQMTFNLLTLNGDIVSVAKVCARAHVCVCVCAFCTDRSSVNGLISTQQLRSKATSSITL